MKNQPLQKPPKLNLHKSQNNNAVKDTFLATKVILALAGALLLFFMMFVVWFFATLNVGVNTVPINGEIIEINPSSSVDQVASTLYQKKLIVNKTVFALYAKFGPAKAQLKPGPYLVKPTSSIRQIVGDMHSGKTAVSKITFPEGITIAEMGKRWQSAGYGSKEDYIAATKKLSLEYSFVPEASKQNPEGYLFPSTYSFKIGSSAETLVRLQYEQFAKQALPLLNQKPVNGLDQNQILTLASIVEKEALTEADRKLVAGVFINRLNQAMNLQSDVTVNYATGKTITEPADIVIDSAYNTYKIKGLPPTPINNPSTNAIETVINFQPNSFIYFLAGKDGKLYYAENYATHVENIKNHL